MKVFCDMWLASIYVILYQSRRPVLVMSVIADSYTVSSHVSPSAPIVSNTACNSGTPEMNVDFFFRFHD